MQPDAALGHIVAWTNGRRTIRCRIKRRGHIVADKTLRTYRCKKFVAWTNSRTDKTLQGQIVAWTKRCNNKIL